MSGIGDFLNSASSTISSMENSVTQSISGVYQKLTGGNANTARIGGSPLPANFGNNLSDSQVSGIYTPNPGYLAILTYAKDSGSDQIQVAGYIDEDEIGYEFASEYGSPFDQGVIEGITGSRKMEEIARGFGFSSLVKKLTSQIWQGTHHLDLSFSMVFVTESAANESVQSNIGKLAQMTLPTGGDGILTAPGPRVNIDLQSLTSAAQTVQGSISSLVSGLGGLFGLGSSSSGQQTGATDQGTLSSIAEAANQGLVGVGSAITTKGNISFSLGQILHLPSVVVTRVAPSVRVQLNRDQRPIAARVQVSIRTYQIPTAEDLATMLSLSAAPSFPTLNTLTNNIGLNKLGNFGSSSFGNIGSTFGL